MNPLNFLAKSAEPDLNNVLKKEYAELTSYKDVFLNKTFQHRFDLRFVQ